MAGESGTIRFKPSLKGQGLSLQLKKKKKSWIANFLHISFAESVTLAHG